MHEIQKKLEHIHVYRWDTPNESFVAVQDHRAFDRDPVRITNILRLVQLYVNTE
jgi:hypothetical protein